MCILFVYQLLSVANHYLRVYLGTVNVISFLTEAETVYLTVPILYNPAIVEKKETKDKNIRIKV